MKYGKRPFLPFIIIVFLASAFSVNGATIHGTVYTLYLEVATGAIVEINTEPRQVKVASDGAYSFELNPGIYLIRAGYRNEDEFFLEKEIKIEKEGSYVLDLVLMPNLEGENGVLEEIEEFTRIEEKRSFWPFLLIGIFILLLVFMIFMRFKKKQENFETKDEEIKSEKEEEIDKLIEFIKTQGGRVTQKEIRKNFPGSEAKISLIIADLEDRGILRKIKKGRGNIIILKD